MLFITKGESDYLGTVTVKPVVRMTPQSPEAVLQWHPVTLYTEPAGELLAAFELIRVGHANLSLCCFSFKYQLA